MVEATEHLTVSLDIEKANEWLDRHWKADRLCPVCGNSTWLGEEQVMELRPFNQDRLGAPGPVIPLLVIICSTCGNTLFFNTILAGLVERPESE